MNITLSVDEKWHSSRLNSLGWQAKVGLEEGLALAYWDFLSK